jgi:helix-turn-helix protein
LFRGVDDDRVNSIFDFIFDLLSYVVLIRTGVVDAWVILRIKILRFP